MLWGGLRPKNFYFSSRPASSSVVSSSGTPGSKNCSGPGMKVCIHNCETDRYMAGDGTWQALPDAATFERVMDALNFCSSREDRNVEIVVSFGTKEEVHIPVHQIVE